jgi:transformation/transcription domain-associated protein
MDLWEEHWIRIQRELSQSQVVSGFASATGNSILQLESAWKSQDWPKVRSLCLSSPLLVGAENGDPSGQMCETLLAVSDGKFTDVENLHAQTAQLCLYKWQLLPKVARGSTAHESLLHFFHRLVEIRDAGQVMANFVSHKTSKMLPDLKDLLNAWRHRLPNVWECLSSWEEILTWRSHFFGFTVSSFQWAKPSSLPSLHDPQWT